MMSWLPVGDLVPALGLSWGQDCSRGLAQRRDKTQNHLLSLLGPTPSETPDSLTQYSSLCCPPVILVMTPEIGTPSLSDPLLGLRSRWSQCLAVPSPDSILQVRGKD